MLGRDGATTRAVQYQKATLLHWLRPSTAACYMRPIFQQDDHEAPPSQPRRDAFCIAAPLLLTRRQGVVGSRRHLLIDWTHTGAVCEANDDDVKTPNPIHIAARSVDPIDRWF
jgi:hypothetical protein